MSLVGTRPPTVDEWEKYELHHRSRMSTKPGITGMWQVSGRSDITDFEEVVRLDTEYIQNWTIGLDIRILIKTVLAFVNILKAIATLLITNSHYEVVYPIKILATGGLLGNSIFFLVSGFCLSNIKENFFLWFRKRIIRIWLPSYMSDYKNVARPFWITNYWGQRVGDYSYIKEALGF